MPEVSLSSGNQWTREEGAGSQVCQLWGHRGRCCWDCSPGVTVPSCPDLELSPCPPENPDPENPVPSTGVLKRRQQQRHLLQVYRWVRPADPCVLLGCRQGQRGAVSRWGHAPPDILTQEGTPTSLLHQADKKDDLGGKSCFPGPRVGVPASSTNCLCSCVYGRMACARMYGQVEVSKRSWAEAASRVGIACPWPGAPGSSVTGGPAHPQALLPLNGWRRTSRSNACETLREHPSL